MKKLLLFLVGIPLFNFIGAWFFNFLGKWKTIWFIAHSYIIIVFLSLIALVKIINSEAFIFFDICY
jgi:hypothetical protein